MAPLSTTKYAKYANPTCPAGFSRAEDAETGLFRLVGPLCDNGDSFYDVDGEALMRRLMTEAPALAAHAAALQAHLVRLPSFRELPAATGPGDLIAALHLGG